MSAYRSFRHLEDTAQDERDRRFFESFRADLESGSSLLESAENQELSRSEVGWLAVGEATGDTEEILPYIVRQQWMASSVGWSIAAASLYLVTMSALAMLVLAGTEWALAFLVASAAAAYLMSRGRGTRRRRLAQYLPVVGPVYRQMAAAQFARALSLQMDRGISPAQALPRAARVLGTSQGLKLGERLANAYVQDGQLANCLKSTGMFSRVDIGFVRCGEETGTLDQIMRQVADRADDRLEDAKQTMIAQGRGASVVGMTALLMMLMVFPPVASAQIAVESLTKSTLVAFAPDAALQSL